MLTARAEERSTSILTTYMPHVRIVTYVELSDDVFPPLHPCIKPLSQGGAAFDMVDPYYNTLAPALALRSISGAAVFARRLQQFCPLTLGPEQAKWTDPSD